MRCSEQCFQSDSAVSQRTMASSVLCLFSQEQVYLASQSALWRLSTTPIAMQIKQLMAKREFELALRLAVSHQNIMTSGDDDISFSHY